MDMRAGTDTALAQAMKAFGCVKPHCAYFGVGLPSVQTVKFNLRFPGQYYDELTKQHYNHNRVG
ncbi:hypothetical protein [Acinetobacter sp. Root1280]|uniref:hypothetical protein n=1 Tax=Acinetobacter sp. Root1280 TaxID=1736444 RepID=UPI000A954C63|nr:hypothetical protein [Acinetobacter sp. Root1280]